MKFPWLELAKLARPRSLSAPAEPQCDEVSNDALGSWLRQPKSRDTTTQENELDDVQAELLIEAAKVGNVDEVRRLCEVVGVDVDMRGYMGWTAAHWAARQGHVHVLEVLHRLGANLDSLDCRGDCLLHKAAANGQLQTCKWLLQHTFNVHATNKHGMTPLDLAREKVRHDKDATTVACEALLADAAECTF
ncbi:hypothetical protein SDRG_13275 [Saprolegnia diclina VS20]|uniref:Uncharacterized protein n=1 Tax=Saprolegnia diclina (strain VS20) TaxID=1156394 RepID=T0Q316_SAPDV|nr:hypothetical protein SDRG_13275 [Saprolegnia diclina VS20]EQC28936.1 hypothetical protein SDRG_13275 [Saprolegnia diclina VS20]|eukprot:XP_008617575.1 hypothetical protein SDRG_13275 [Saprolegnia diclina VS20]